MERDEKMGVTGTRVYDPRDFMDAAEEEAPKMKAEEVSATRQRYNARKQEEAGEE